MLPQLTKPWSVFAGNFGIGIRGVGPLNSASFGGSGGSLMDLMAFRMLSISRVPVVLGEVDSGMGGTMSY